MARTYLAASRQYFPNMCLWLSSYAVPSLHPKFPYAAWLNGKHKCDGLMGQVYGSKPLKQFRKMRKECENRFSCANIPTVRAYQGDGFTNWPEIIQTSREVIEECKSLCLGFNSWNWQAAERRADTWQLVSGREFTGASPAIEGPEDNDASETVSKSGPLYEYNPSKYSTMAKRLQRLINNTFEDLRLERNPIAEDGYLGQITSDAFYVVFGCYLPGDPRIDDVAHSALIKTVARDLLEIYELQQVEDSLAKTQKEIP